MFKLRPSKQLRPPDVYQIVIQEIKSIVERECTFNERYDIFWVTKIIVSANDESEDDICRRIIPLLSMSMDYWENPSVPLVSLLDDVTNCPMTRLDLIKVDPTDVDNDYDQHCDASEELSALEVRELCFDTRISDDQQRESAKGVS